MSIRQKSYVLKYGTINCLRPRPVGLITINSMVYSNDVISNKDYILESTSIWMGCLCSNFLGGGGGGGYTQKYPGGSLKKPSGRFTKKSHTFHLRLFLTGQKKNKFIGFMKK